MTPHLALGHCFFSPEDVELASLIPNIKDPELDAMENPFPLKRSDYTVKRVDDYSAFLRMQKDDKAEAFLSQVARWTSRKSRLANMHLAARSGNIYTLRKPTIWFRRLCGNDMVRDWVQEQIEDGNAVHLVVGLHTLFDAATTSNAKLASEHSGQVSLPISEMGGWSLGDTGDVGISAGHKYNKDSRNACTAPGEQIFAIRVKRVIFRFWDTHDIDNARLGKNSYWKMASDNRSATEDDSEIVEAFLEEDLEDPEVEDNEEYDGKRTDDNLGDGELYFFPDSDEDYGPRQ